MQFYDFETRRDAWIIDYDHLENRVPDVAGPHDAPEAALAVLGEPRGPRNYRQSDPPTVRRFRIYDDDGELYYSGRQYLDDDATEQGEFGPLDDYGTPNDGATELRYFEAGEWKTL